MRALIVRLAALALVCCNSAVAQQWDDLSAISDEGGVAQMAVDGNSIIALSAAGHLFRSSDGGKTWSLPLRTTKVRSMTRSGENIITVGADSVVHSSKDFGSSFSDMSGIPCMGEASPAFYAAESSSRLYAVCANGGPRSIAGSDPGSSWGPRQFIGSVGGQLYSTGDAVFYFDHSNQLIRMDDVNGQELQTALNGDFHQIATCENTLYATGISGNEPYLVSTTPGSGNRPYHVWTTSGGNDWFQISLPPQISSGLMVEACEGDQIVIATGAQWYYSPDRGVTWKYLGSQSCIGPMGIGVGRLYAFCDSTLRTLPLQ